jgi:hypothetical protein
MIHTATFLQKISLTLAAGLTFSAPVFGQTQVSAETPVAIPPAAAGTSSSTAGQAQSSDQSTAPTADELKAMKKRIEVLEADLKTRSIVAPGDEDPNSNKEPIAPFSDQDWTWLMGMPRNHDTPLATKHFIPEIRADINYNLDFNHPTDDTISGSSEIFRAQEIQIEQLGIGGDFYLSNVHARVMTQFGEYSVTTPRNDASQGRGQWNLANAYRYLSEAYGGYHINHLKGVNVDAGIFMSYVGLFGYYNFDNWAYQPSFVSSNTPWFFNGVRGQFFPTPHLKIEPWFTNGWQAYGRFNSKPGLGGQIKYNPTGNWNFISNNYGYGEDDLGVANRARIHTDNSAEYKWFERPTSKLDRMATSLTFDAGCEFGAGYPQVVNLGTGYVQQLSQTPVACHGNKTQIVAGVKQVAVKQSFLGFMSYTRLWFNHDRQGFTIGGGMINNPGRYLVLTPVINGATALAESPYFPQTPGDAFRAADFTLTYDYMPRQYLTYRMEYGYRHADQPYWTGRRGMTPPGGSQNSAVGNSADYVCSNGQTSFDSGLSLGVAGTTGAKNTSLDQTYMKGYCSNPANIPISTVVASTTGTSGFTLWQPDLRKDEQKLTFALMVKF